MAFAPDPGCIIAQEIHRFADFRYSIQPCLARLAHHDGHQLGMVGFIKVSSPFKDFSALGCGSFRPARECLARGCDCLPGDLFIRPADRADLSGGISWAEYGMPLAEIPFVIAIGGHFGFEFRQRCGIAEVPAARIPATGKNFRRQGNFRMGDLVLGLETGNRVGGYFLGRNRLVEQLVDERGIGTVFEKAANEIGQQILVNTDRRIDAARAPVLALADIVQGIAHAMQALEFELHTFRCHLFDGNNRMCIVGGKLRIDAVGHGEQFARAN